MVFLSKRKYDDMEYDIMRSKERISFLEKEYFNLWHSVRNLYNHLELEEQTRPEMRVVVKKKEQSF